MSDLTPTMLARTPLSVTVTHHTSHGLSSVWPKVYFQDSHGRIRTVDGNAGGVSTVVVDKANLNNQFAAERCYYMDHNGGIYEHCWSFEKGWYAGGLNGQFKAAFYSSLAAATYSFSGGSMHHIQLYYQVPETLEICELYKNGNNPWVQGVRHPAGAQATSIAAATTGEGTQVWYQTQDTKFVQWLFEAGEEWKKGNFVSDLEYRPGAAITLASRIRVFTVTKDNKLALTVYRHERWEPSKILINQVPFASAAGLAHPRHHSNNFVATVYCQKRAGEITKVQFNPDHTWEESTLPVQL